MNFLTRWRRAKLVGKIDQIDRRVLRGWVFDHAKPRKRLTVDVFCQGILLGQATAGFARPDLRKAGLGDGRFEFRMDISMLPHDAFSNVVVTVSQHPEVEITTEGAIRHKGTIVDRPLPSANLRPALEPLLRNIETYHRPYRKRSGNPQLLETDTIFGLPLSAFARHVAYKFGWPRAGWSREDVDGFLDWYVSEYVVSQAPRRVPWSRDEIAFWSRSSLSLKCRASERFSHRAHHLSRARTAYDWAIEDSRRLFVEDVFVNSDLVKRLRSVHAPGNGREFPLSKFMHLFMKENGRLRSLPTGKLGERQAVYAALMLYGLASPHLLTYLPGRWLAAMLDEKSSARLFKDALASIGIQTQDDVGRRYIQALQRRGYDVFDQAWIDTGQEHLRSTDGNEISSDVQLIGPLCQTLGLGESARRLAAALIRCAPNANLANYDLGNASPYRAADLPLGLISTARVTILHLNLEEIPEAVAYLPGFVSKSYLVAIPYIELSAPSAAHELGSRMVQEIWTASSFLQSVFERVCQRTYIVGMPARLEPTSPVTQEQGERLLRSMPDRQFFIFLVTADALSWVQRKNVLGVLIAFQDAFDRTDAVRLVIKTHNRAVADERAGSDLWRRIEDHVARDTRMTLIDETFDDATYRLLLSQVHCLVSLHRAEGLGLDLLDAMGMGTAVVATAYSGNADFCTSEVCWPVGFDLVGIKSGDYPYVEDGHMWAEPKRDEAIESLRQVYRDARERKARTERARQHIRAVHSVEAVSSQIAARLEAITSLQAEKA